MNDKNSLTAEKERINSIHLSMVIVASIGGASLVAESIMMGWEIWMVPLFAAGLVALWWIHISQMWTPGIREKCYVAYLIAAAFFHGAHETSFFDVALMSCLMMITLAQVDDIRFEYYALTEYLVVLAMQFYLAVRGGTLLTDPLGISRILLHIAATILVQRLCVHIVRNRLKYRKYMTEYREAMELRDLEMDDFMTNISHELRTPVNVVNGISTMVMEQDNQAGQVGMEEIRAIHRAGLRIAGQIEDISDYIEIDSGTLRLEESKYMISSLINDIVVNMRLEKGSLELVIDLDPNVPAVMRGDVGKLRKVIEHLLGNAVKFTKSGGIYLKITAQPREYGVNLDIQVTDTGIGMPRQVVGKSGHGLYQANRSRDRSSGGIGLGLSIVYGFVHRMNGFVGIESTEGAGTTVRISIPQSIVDPSPCLSVDLSVERCVVCYIRPEKYSTPALRDFNQSMAANIAKGLKILLHNATSLKELENMCERMAVTHIFMGREEYEEAPAFFDALSMRHVCVAVSSDEALSVGTGSRVLCMPKPLYGFPITNILNAGEDYAAVRMDESDKKIMFNGVKALVVDDEVMNLVVASGIFKGYGMEIDTVSSGKEALDKYIAGDYEVIFMDHMMPEMDGVVAMKRLREIAADTGRSPVIVALTANAVSGAREMFMSEGFDGFIAKPIEKKEFERVMKRVLSADAVSYIGG
ncbi:MAG: response regulator [Lachnospiraceae bacterium]|nr:response regulator [Lachnospiraceae bacterium]